MNRVKLALGGFATGALLMYLSDPDRGKRRRALARDKAVSAWNDFATLLDKARRDVSNRAYAAASSGGRWRRSRAALEPPAQPQRAEPVRRRGGNGPAYTRCREPGIQTNCGRRRRSTRIRVRQGGAHSRAGSGCFCVLVGLREVSALHDASQGGPRLGSR